MSDSRRRAALVPSVTALLAGILGPLSLASPAVAAPDPFERANRKVHAFNEGVDRYAIEPVARAFEWVVPDFVERRLDNFFDNLRTPVILGNDILQLKPRAAGEDVVRFVTNTTFGLAGLFDVATREGIPKHDEDFGQTLGYWGVPPGPFLMLPILGPSNLRDLTGFGVDSVANIYGFFAPFWVSLSANTLSILNRRAMFLDEIRQNRAMAVDYYIFLRDAYVQNREARVHDREGFTAEEQDDLYYFDDELDDELDEVNGEVNGETDDAVDGELDGEGGNEEGSE